MTSTNESDRAPEPSRSAAADMGRERWVRALYNLARYGRGRMNIGRLEPVAMADMRDLAAQGPGRRMAEKDPDSYETLREAATMLFVDGVLAVAVLPDWCIIRQ